MIDRLLHVFLATLIAMEITPLTGITWCVSLPPLLATRPETLPAELALSAETLPAELALTAPFTPLTLQ